MINTASNIKLKQLNTFISVLKKNPSLFSMSSRRLCECAHQSQKKNLYDADIPFYGLIWINFRDRRHSASGITKYKMYGYWTDVHTSEK